MKTLLEHMQAHHGRCDQLYADGENFLLDEQIEEGLESIKSFLNEMERHFQMEETVLFPTFEEISGMRQGPTQVMRMEHQQMRFWQGCPRHYQTETGRKSWKSVKP